jgi:hypothetical protein
MSISGSVWFFSYLRENIHVFIVEAANSSGHDNFSRPTTKKIIQVYPFSVANPLALLFAVCIMLSSPSASALVILLSK